MWHDVSSRRFWETVKAQREGGEQGGQPERRIGRVLKSMSLGRRRVTLVVLLMASHQVAGLLGRAKLRPNSASDGGPAGARRSHRPMCSEGATSIPSPRPDPSRSAPSVPDGVLTGRTLSFDLTGF